MIEDFDVYGPKIREMWAKEMQRFHDRIRPIGPFRFSKKDMTPEMIAVEKKLEKYKEK